MAGLASDATAAAMIAAYASRTGTRRNLDALRAAGWRLLVSATGRHRCEGFPYAIDNGAWTAYTKGLPWDEAAFRAVVGELGGGADFIVLPDIVAGGRRSLDLSLSWMGDRLLLSAGRPLLIPVQNGMHPGDVRPYLDERTGVFIGGTTAWKLETLPTWAALARERRAWCHVGRVNSCRRIRLCLLAGASSFDGTAATRFSANVGRLDSARRQLTWVWP